MLLKYILNVQVSMHFEFDNNFPAALVIVLTQQCSPTTRKPAQMSHLICTEKKDSML